MYGLGLPELVIIFVIGFLAIWPIWLICVKAGFSGWLTLLVLIPFGAPALLFYMAFTDWPSLAESKRQMDQNGTIK